ncbi:hypothetical protein AB0C27_42830 [Nonomuraea sp. NPDC048882]
MKFSARGHHRIDEADMAGPQPELLRALSMGIQRLPAGRRSVGFRA